MSESTVEAMVRLGVQYAGQDDGWGHYDVCPMARPEMCDGPDDCICRELEVEYEDERPT